MFKAYAHGPMAGGALSYVAKMLGPVFGSLPSLRLGWMVVIMKALSGASRRLHAKHLRDEHGLALHRARGQDAAHKPRKLDSTDCGRERQYHRHGRTVSAAIANKLKDAILERDDKKEIFTRSKAKVERWVLKSRTQ